MRRRARETLVDLIGAEDASRERLIIGLGHSLPLSRLNAASRLRGGTTQYSGLNIMLRTRGQLATVLAAAALDGIANRLLFCPADIPDSHIPRLMLDGEVGSTITDNDVILDVPRLFQREYVEAPPFFDTEWVLFTSGTSGVPKLVQHSLASLTAPLRDNLSPAGVTWGTFYDVRRYGGMQILLRALLCAGTIVLPEASEPVSSFLMRLTTVGATHISGTPSHWRRVLMSGAAALLHPTYVRLSGEMVGQDILNQLRVTYPEATIVHAYASTEAGVAFSVDDGKTGFPSSILERQSPWPQVRIESGTLRVRSSANAACYLGHPSRQLGDAEGFVDTGDLVEHRGNRCFFSGRREGVVNIGGMKVHPEEVEAAINQHPAIAVSRVWGRASPITGTLIAADVVLARPADGRSHNFSQVREEVMTLCRTSLAAHKVPVRLTEVSEIPMTSSGKIERYHA